MAYVMEPYNTFTVICPSCGRRIGYDESDMYMGCSKDGTDGLVIDCPNCGDMIFVEECEPTEWPKAFYAFGEGKEAVHLPDNEIQQMIDKCVKNMMDNKEFEYYYIASGDIMVYCFWDDKDIDVYVAKNYYHALVGEEYLEKRYGNRCTPYTKNKKCNVEQPNGGVRSEDKHKET